MFFQVLLHWSEWPMKKKIESTKCWINKQYNSQEKHFVQVNIAVGFQINLSIPTTNNKLDVLNLKTNILRSVQTAFMQWMTICFFIRTRLNFLANNTVSDVFSWICSISYRTCKPRWYNERKTLLKLNDLYFIYNFASFAAYSYWTNSVL